MASSGLGDSVVEMSKRRLCYGVGINDAPYVVRYKENGAEVTCPYYATWYNMLSRCYNSAVLKRPTYKGCSVCEEWLTFTNFRAWMEQQDWEGKSLDKDLIGDGKLYSPDTCVFVSKTVNSFLTDRKRFRGDYPLGCSYHKATGKFISNVNNPLTGEFEYLGLYTTQESAHLAWKKRKHELACQLAGSEYVTDKRVADALRARYL